MNLHDWLSLALATACIAAFLVVEHFLTEKGLKLPTRWNYAMGLVTVLIGLLFWGILRGITLTPLSAAAILTAGCLSGLPDFLILHREEQQRQAEDRQRQVDERANLEAWKRLAAENRQLAAELALLRIVGQGRHYSRAHDLLETVAFIRGDIHQDLRDMRLIVDQLAPLLGDLLPEQFQEGDHA